MGAALTEAIAKAGEQPTDILIVTDASQSNSCGPDICDVAFDLLPKPNIFVETVFVQAKSSDEDRLSCVEAAQFAGALTPKAETTEQASETAKPPSPPDKPAEEASTPGAQNFDLLGFIFHYTTKWYWGFVFALYCGGALLIGRHYGLETTRVLNDIENIKTKPSSDGDQPSPTQAALNQMPAAEDDADEDINDQKEKAHEKKRGVKLLKVATALLIPMLFLEVPFFNEAKQAAWEVVNTDFANAFAILAISFVVFSASQYWRFSLAQGQHAFVSGEVSRREEESKKLEHQNRLNRYNQLRSQVQALDVSIPMQWKFFLDWSSIEKLRALSRHLALLAADNERASGKIRLSHIAALEAYVRRSWDIEKLTNDLAEKKLLSEDAIKELNAFFDDMRFRRTGRGEARLDQLLVLTVAAST